MLRTLHAIQIIITAFAFSAMPCEAFPQTGSNDLKFDFGDGVLKTGFIRVTGDMMYDPARGYGFVSESPIQDVKSDNNDPLLQDLCTSAGPFYFIVDLPEGNYKIKMTFGDEKDSTCTTVKAESRRLMLECVKTKPGEYETRTIVVNVRTPAISSGDSIHIKSREQGFLNWDNKLSLEFNNSRPCIDALEITAVQKIQKVILAGNSTVVDQEFEPWCSWGQMITNFLSDDIEIGRAHV